METKNLKKIVTKNHNWDFRIDFTQMYDIKWEMIFVTVSFALAITSYVGMGKATSVSGFIVSYISMVVMLVAFSINFVNLFRHLVLMACGCYHVVKQNVDEQKDIDYGTTTAFYDPTPRRCIPKRNTSPWFVLKCRRTWKTKPRRTEKRGSRPKSHERNLRKKRVQSPVAAK